MKSDFDYLDGLHGTTEELAEENEQLRSRVAELEELLAQANKLAGNAVKGAEQHRIGRYRAESRVAELEAVRDAAKLFLHQCQFGDYNEWCRAETHLQHALAASGGSNES